MVLDKPQYRAQGFPFLSINLLNPKGIWDFAQRSGNGLVPCRYTSRIARKSLAKCLFYNHMLQSLHQFVEIKMITILLADLKYSAQPHPFLQNS